MVTVNKACMTFTVIQVGKKWGWGNERKTSKPLVLSRSLFKDGEIEDKREPIQGYM